MVQVRSLSFVRSFTEMKQQNLPGDPWLRPTLSFLAS